MSPLHLSILFAGLLSACSTINDFPDHWAKLDNIHDGQCPELTGTFSNRGESEETGCPIPLATILFQEELSDSSDPALNKVQRIRLTTQGSQVTATALTNEYPIATAVFSADTGQIACQDGFWVIDRAAWVSWSSFVGNAREVSAFALNQDGLVARRRVRVYGMSLFVPIGVSAESWVLYRRNYTDDSASYSDTARGVEQQSDHTCP